MNPFDKALDFVLSQEGGYSNDVRDSGGETNFGISKKAYPDEDIKNMTRERAGELYRRDYYDKCNCGSLPFPVALMLFDAAVNQGPARAARMLQEAVKVHVDGVIGQETVEAVNRLGIKETLAAFAGKRAFQYGLHPQFVAYGFGWLRRLAACLLTSMEPI